MHFVSDQRLKSMLQEYLEDEEQNNLKTKGIRLCGTGTLKMPGMPYRAYIMRDTKNAKKVRTHGVMTCKNSWGCPTCTAIRLAQIGSDIECLIKALNKQGLDAYMFTFSAQNVRQFKCDEIFNFQAMAWRKFYNYRRTKKTYTIKSGKNAGKKVTYNIKPTPWNNFCETFKVEHVVRVYDFTWSDKHSWHPHVHALIFIPRELRKKFADSFEQIERELQENWLHQLQLAAKQYLTKKYKDDPKRRDELIKETNALYNMDYFEAKTVNSKPIWISRNKQGKPRFVANARYVTGWSFNKELTSQRKQGHIDKSGDKHYTPYEMLQYAYERKDKRRYILQKFVEFIMATRSRKRVTITKGDKKIINEYKLSEEYEIDIKKNITEAGEQEAVVWFSDAQWSEIYFIKQFKNPQIITMILKRARFSDLQKARESICTFLIHYNLDISRNNFDDRQAKRYTEIVNFCRKAYLDPKLRVA